MGGFRDGHEEAEPSVASVDGTAGETLLPSGTAGHWADADAATQKPQAVPVTELILTHPAKVQAQADAAAKAEAEAKATAERERRLARAEADYQRAVMEAAARLAHDDGYADLVHDIIRHKGLNTVEGYDQVDRNFLAERRDYYGALAAQRAERDAGFDARADGAIPAAERMAHDDAYADLVYGAARARGERVQTIDPEFTGGSRDPQTAIEEKKLERHLQRQADLEAERRKFGEIVRDDETGQYLGPTEEGRKALKQASDDERFRRLGYDDMAANEVEKWWRQHESAAAIRHLRAVERFKQKEAEVRQKIANNEALSPDEESVRAGMHLSEQIMARETRRALGDLATAQARLAQLPDSPGLRKLKEADTVGGIITALVNHPLEILAVKAGQAVPKTIASTAGTLLMGPYGGVLASAYVAFGSEYAGAVLQGFRDEGIDLENESAVQEAIKNKEKIERIYNKALVVAGIATMADIASGAVGNMRVTPIQSKIVEKGAQIAVQADIAVTAKKATDKALGKGSSKGERSEAGLDGAVGALMPDVERLSF